MQVATDPRTTLERSSTQTRVDMAPGFNAVELCVVTLTVLIVLAFALHNGTIAIRKARSAEAFSFAGPLMEEVVLHRSLHGSWPNAANFPPVPTNTEERPNEPQVIPGEQGAFSLRLTRLGNAYPGEGHTVTFRPAVVMDAPSGPVVWVCGRGAVPEGYTVFGTDLTDIPDVYLPYQCSTGGQP